MFCVILALIYKTIRIAFRLNILYETHETARLSSVRNNGGWKESQNCE